jgi:hypothetical protein
VKSTFKEGVMLSDHKHIRILTPLGVCMGENGLPMILLPLMTSGDLHKYLRDHQIVIPVRNLIEFAQQVAEGISKSISDSNQE